MAETCLYVDEVNQGFYFEELCAWSTGDPTLSEYYPGEEVIVPFPDGQSFGFIYEPGRVPDGIFEQYHDAIATAEAQRAELPLSDLDKIGQWLDGASSWIDGHTDELLIGCVLLGVVIGLVLRLLDSRRLTACDQCGFRDDCELDATGHTVCPGCEHDRAITASAA